MASAKQFKPMLKINTRIQLLFPNTIVSITIIHDRMPFLIQFRQSSFKFMLAQAPSRPGSHIVPPKPLLQSHQTHTKYINLKVQHISSHNPISRQINLHFVAPADKQKQRPKNTSFCRFGKVCGYRFDSGVICLTLRTIKPIRFWALAHFQSSSQ